MVGKLMGFEFRSSMKYLAAIWAALLVSSIFAGFAGRFLQESAESTLSSLIGVCVMGLFIIIFIAMIVATIFVIVVRFYNGLLGEEGYLMHALPVKEWQLITAKGLCALVIVLISILVGIISMGLSLIAVDSLEALKELTDAAIGGIRENPSVLVVVGEMVLLAIIGLLGRIYQIYASLAIGQLVNKYRILLAIGAYIGINFVLSLITGVLAIITGSIDYLNDTFANTFGIIDTAAEMVLALQPGMIILILAALLQLVIFHVITERILSTRLNLQ